MEQYCKTAYSGVLTPLEHSTMEGCGLIRSVRQALHSVLRQQILDEEGLQTILCEVEAILNSRLITTVSSDPQDRETLTPNHILLLKSKPTQLPPGLFDKNDMYVRRHWTRQPNNIL